MTDSLKIAKERYQEATEAMRETHARMREDLAFSNPADPQQWDKDALTWRKGRPCLRFDRTNQFVAQVVNAGRQNKPSIQVLPVDSKADPEVAEQLNGIIRHIEYTSRAGIAYDTALEYAARIGLGWIRIVNEVARPETNEQEIRIKRVHDPLSVHLDPNSTEPDGSDAMWGLVETTLTKKAFERLYPKAKLASFEGDALGWFGEDSVRICEHLYIVEEKQNRIMTDLGPLSEDEYWQIANTTGVKPQYISNFEAVQRSVKWCKVSGAEILEETDFPSQYLPLVPVLGYELWQDGKRYLCGMVRRLMDGQRAYNYERSAFIEAVALQPKAPIMADHRSVEGFEQEWENMNRGNPGYLPYNGLDESGNPLPTPQRLSPPAFPVAFAQGGEIAGRDMEAALGMFDANLGNQGTAVSGRAKMADQRRGDIANFHYVDNLSRSIEQIGRIVVDMIPRIYDTQRQARILGEDGKPSFVEVDPQMPQAAQKQGKKVVAINPGVGSYDVRVKTGPGYPTQRVEAAERLAEMVNGNPQAMAMMGDILVELEDWPQAEKIKRRFQAMLPPEIQAAEREDQELPPEAIAAISQAEAQVQEMQGVLEQVAQELESTKAQLENKQGELLVKAFEAETDRMGLVIGAEGKTTEAPDVSGLIEAQRQKYEAEIQRIKDDKQREFEAWKAELEAKTKLAVAEISANTTVKTAEMSAAKSSQDQGHIEAVKQAVSQLSEVVTGKKVAKIERVRDASGKMIAARRHLANGEVEEIPIA